MRKLMIVLSLALVCAVPSFGSIHAGRRAAKASYRGAKFAGKASLKAAKAAFNFAF